MSPKSILLLVVVGLCAAQMAAAAPRHERGIADLLAAARAKLTQVLKNAEDAARSSVETVFNLVSEVEEKALDKGTEYLAEQGIDVNLTTVAVLLKGNVKVCANDDQWKTEATGVVKNVAGCVVKNVDTLLDMAEDAKELWETAKTLPTVMKKVADQCKAHADTDMPKDALAPGSTADALVAITAELDPNHDLTADARQILKAASHHLSKRDLWGFSRITRCVQAVYSLTKTDLVNIPGEILSIAARGYSVVQGAQASIPACVGKRVVDNLPTITKVASQLGVCVAKGVASEDELMDMIEANPKLAGLQNLVGVAEKLGALQNSGNALEALKTAGQLLG
ncbi:Glycerol-3-phosphate dehydrogenase [NAD(P)+] [Frankliniella fusca]|uniref:Glycerol-3-phosphate dehydrogenase [NAD(P)+] n=1 Tax=Frankliniella fusca TaxID=407009 RepID=A0AAE1GRY0_9NEOP|nr:Glycerol-3-phosphate dehydrogenase [NAD(P)+] [Frankliniella fusca]